jgi:hypothetical protein
MTCLVSDGNASLDVYEAIGVPAIDPVNDVILFNPLGVNLPQPFPVLSISLKKMSVERSRIAGVHTLTNCILRNSGAVFSIVFRLSA